MRNGIINILHTSSLSVKVGAHQGSAFIYHGKECSDKRCEGRFFNGVFVCKKSCCMRGIIK